MKNLKSKSGISRKQFVKNVGGAFLSGSILAGALPPQARSAGRYLYDRNLKINKNPVRVAADPRKIPPPINRQESITHRITLESKEVIGEIEDGVQFLFLTFGGQVPGPMIRVRQGDTVILTHVNSSENSMLHNVDFHAVYGTGGGAEGTMCPPGQSRTIKFQALYPGAFIYHCAVPRLDYHISSGMFGMIVVEPPEGLPQVDQEFYFGQHEVYTDKEVGTKGVHGFNTEAMIAENPNYVLLNGEVAAITNSRYGALKVKRDEIARIFMVTGGPNITSNFHPIGNVWTKAWRGGAIASQPERYLQTCHVAPGSCGIFEMDFPVPGSVKLVDHALSRVAHKGTVAVIEVEGEEQPHIFETHLS